MTANYRGNPNHAQVGINDTPLTAAIEKGDFKTAEKLIEESVEPSYLDEGISVVYMGKMPYKLC